jgi:Cu(I)/Ag(I) efflux system membrane fusion protein
LQAVAETEVYKKVTQGIINQEKIKSISARAMGRSEKYISKPKAIIFKKIRRFQLYSEDLAIAKHDYFTAFKQLSMPGDFGKKC